MTAATRRPRQRRTGRTTQPRKGLGRTEVRVAGLEEWVRITSETVDSLTRMVVELSNADQALNGAIKANMKGSIEVVGLLVSQLVALRNLLIAKGVITLEEATTVAQVADLERMLGRLSDNAAKDSDSDTPAGGAC